MKIDHLPWDCHICLCATAGKYVCDRVNCSSDVCRCRCGSSGSRCAASRSDSTEASDVGPGVEGLIHKYMVIGIPHRKRLDKSHSQIENITKTHFRRLSFHNYSYKTNYDRCHYTLSVSNLKFVLHLKTPTLQYSRSRFKNAQDKKNLTLHFEYCYLCNTY